MNFATTRCMHTISFYDDVSLDINLLDILQILEIQNSRSSSPHLPGVRPVCPKVSRSPKRVHCPTVPIVPTLNRPSPPTCRHLFFCRGSPIGQFWAGLKSRPTGWINRHFYTISRKEGICRSVPLLVGCEWYLKLAKVDRLDVGLFDHSIRISQFQCDYVRNRWYLLFVYECGAK